jgi:superfamily II DNA or RNA helicase
MDRVEHIAMSAKILRPYQAECTESVLDAIELDGLNRILYTAPTASGKSVIFAELTRRLLIKGHRVLILAHRIELVNQAISHIRRHCGLREYEVEGEANVWRASSSARVVVGMVQTCCRPNRPAPPWEPTVIITDESHRAAAKLQYQSIYKKHGVPDGRCILIGCTATARRTDRQSLYALKPDNTPVMLEQKKGKPPIPANPDTSVFQKLVYDYDILSAVEDGWIVEPHVYRVESDTDISKVRTVAGEFVEKDLAEAVDTDRRTLQAISRWKEIAADRSTLVFCVTCEHARHAAALWRDAGYNAVDINGETDPAERHEAFESFKSGKLQVICNVGIATEGTDLPICSCITMLAPTKSWTKYVQCLSSDTEILTSHGWKGMGEISEGDCVPSLDMQTGKGRWVRVIGTTERDMGAEEKWIEHEAPRANFRVTDGHNMLCSTGGTARQEHRTEWYMTEARNLRDLEKARLRMPAAVQIDQPGVPLTDAELYFIGIMMTDGTWTEVQASISQSSRYPDVMNRIESCLTTLNMTWRKTRHKGDTQFKERHDRWVYTISAGKTRSGNRNTPPYLRGEMREREAGEHWHNGETGFRHLMPYLDKDFAPALMALSKSQFLTLVLALHDGDGMKLKDADYTPQGWRICSARKLFIDRMQALAAINGCTATYSTEQGPRTNPIYWITVTPKDWRSIGGYGERRPHVENNPGTKERVWCIETETGTIITRRRGKVTVMGNCIGRGSRTLDGLLDGMERATPQERRDKIAASAKVNNLVIDVVDACDNIGDLCTGPAILDLPVGLDLEGHGVAEVKRMLDEHEEDTAIVASSSPASFTEVQGRLVAVNILRRSHAESVKDWRIGDGATYRYVKLPPGYHAEMTQSGDRYRFHVKHAGQSIYDKTGKPISAAGEDEPQAMQRYFDYAARHAQTAIDAHKASLPPSSRGTLARLSEKQVNVLLRDGMSREQIDAMPWGYARKRIGEILATWYGGRVKV